MRSDTIDSRREGLIFVVEGGAQWCGSPSQAEWAAIDRGSELD